MLMALSLVASATMARAQDPGIELTPVEQALARSWEVYRAKHPEIFQQMYDRDPELRDLMQRSAESRARPTTVDTDSARWRQPPTPRYGVEATRTIERELAARWERDKRILASIRPRAKSAKKAFKWSEKHRRKAMKKWAKGKGKGKKGRG
jgi:hypothetical protein